MTIFQNAAEVADAYEADLAVTDEADLHNLTFLYDTVCSVDTVKGLTIAAIGRELAKGRNLSDKQVAKAVKSLQNRTGEVRSIMAAAKLHGVEFWDFVMEYNDAADEMTWKIQTLVKALGMGAFAAKAPKSDEADEVEGEGEGEEVPSQGASLFETMSANLRNLTSDEIRLLMLDAESVLDQRANLKVAA
jgi:hypothetical protein